jgi:ABC-type transport system involved in cytochrome c biogenesis ATPase subunit
MSSEPRSLTGVSVRGLLGSKRFRLRLDSGGATLLTGANGSGKSTVLRIIDCFGRAAWRALSDLPFEDVAFTFSDGLSVTVVRTEQGLDIGNGREVWTFEPTWQGELKNLVFTTAPPDTTIYNEIFSSEPAVDLTQSVASSSAKKLESLWSTSFGRATTPDWLSEIVDAFNVLFITDRRLVLEDKRLDGKEGAAESVSTAVTAYARDLRSRVLSALSDYGEQAQALDRAFPNKVLRAMRAAAATDRNRRAAVAALRRVEQKRERLQNAGLIQSDEPPPALEKNLNTSEIAFIQTYAENALTKYEVLDPLLGRVTALTAFLNTRYVGKQIVLDREHGFVVELVDESVLEPAALSSGEQQMLVLAYQIIFLASPQTLVLIDEPELSLHVTWQTTLVDDLLAMGAASQLSFILATHSPTLIGGRRALRRSLDRQRA